MNTEVKKAYNRERVRLKAACGKFLKVKEPVHCLEMIMMHIFGMRSELNALLECLSSPSRRVDEETYFKTLIHHMHQQIDILCEGMPGTVIDEDGRIHESATSKLSKPGREDLLN